MKTVVMGAGLIGVCSAYFLAKSGHEIIVVDRQKDVAMETSFANGGQVSVCYSEPWSNFENIKKIITWLGKEDSPILLKPHFDIQQWMWGLQFLKECIPYRNHENIKSMLKIALYSRNTLQQLRTELNLEYEQITNGILTYYTSEKSFKGGKESSKFISQFGCERTIKSTDEIYNIEPALKYSPIKIFGGDYTKDDESGNAKIFTEQMKLHCEHLGVKFLFEHDIKNIQIDNTKNKINHLQLSNNKNEESFFLKADNFVCCMGSYTSLLAKNIGIYLPIYPAKGYSATLDITDSDKINSVSLTDSEKKIVFTRLGNKLRVAGTAEFNGYNLELNKSRCEALLKRTQEVFPLGLNLDNPKYWAGLRPATPGNVPIISKSKIDNFFINSGHGTLGWTMAAGSGKLISQIINQEKTFS